MASENGQEKRETLADIAAEIREYGDRPPPKRAWLDIAERIEAIDSADAWRSLYTPGNAAAMREALMQVSLSCSACPRHNCKGCTRPFASVMPAVRKALSAPPRNCDVGTAEDQKKKFRLFCESHKPAESEFTETGELLCPASGCELGVCNYGQCALKWAQMPYEAQEGGEE